MHRRQFLQNSALFTAMLASGQASAFAQWKNGKRKRVALVGTGIRGSSLWGKNLVDNYAEEVEFVGLCDKNAGRLAYVKDHMGADCPTFVDFDEMMRTTKPEWVIVTTMDSTHDIFIVKAMEAGAHVITEKPMTTDAAKCQAILDTQKRTGKDVLVTFNFRHTPHNTAVKQLLHDQRVGEITSVDFHWYLNVYHEIVVHDNFNPDFERVKVPKYRYGRGGGDKRMSDYLFVNPDAADPLSHMAGTRDGALSILIGVAARKSIDEGRAVRLDELVKI